MLVRLPGRLQGEEGPAQNVCLLCVHGGGRDRRTFLRMLPWLTQTIRGLSVLLFDLRDHGTSDADGCGLTLGIREHADVVATFAHVRSVLGFARVILFGTSVGASSSLLAAARIAVASGSDRDGLAGVIAENGLCDIAYNARGLVSTALRVHKLTHSWAVQLFGPAIALARALAPHKAAFSLRRRCSSLPETAHLKQLQHRFGVRFGTDIGVCLSARACL